MLSQYYQIVKFLISKLPIKYFVILQIGKIV